MIFCLYLIQNLELDIIFGPGAVQEAAQLEMEFKENNVVTDEVGPGDTSVDSVGWKTSTPKRRREKGKRGKIKDGLKEDINPIDEISIDSEFSKTVDLGENKKLKLDKDNEDSEEEVDKFTDTDDESINSDMEGDKEEEVLDINLKVGMDEQASEGSLVEEEGQGLYTDRQMVGIQGGGEQLGEMCEVDQGVDKRKNEGSEVEGQGLDMDRPVVGIQGEQLGVHGEVVQVVDKKLPEESGEQVKGQGGQVIPELVTGKEDCQSLGEGFSSGAAVVGYSPDSPSGDSGGS